MTIRTARLTDRNAHRTSQQRVFDNAWTLVSVTAGAWLDGRSRPIASPMTADKTALRRAAGEGALVWDVRPTPVGDRRRKPRGVSLGAVDWVVDDATTGALTDAGSIARVLARIGIRPGRPVIVYADRATDGFRALRALRSIGVDNASVFVERRRALAYASGSARPTDGALAPALASFWVAQARNHPMRTWRGRATYRG